ncbi:MAG: ribbon-helix-helix domain-containing protein [Promethearchaeota archaeon]
MKIVTVNVPEAFLEKIDILIGEDGLYPSRSELIRCAVRDFLLKELKLARKTAMHYEPVPDNLAEFDLEDKNYVRIPMDTRDENNEPKREFKTYKIIKRLEY